MKRFKKILYIMNSRTIRDQDREEKVANLARINDAWVSVMIADETSLFSDVSLKVTGRYEQINQAVRQQNREELKRFLSNERWNGIAVEPDDTADTHFITIIQKVIRGGFDLVVRSDSLDRGIDQLSMRLVRKCPCPVWIIKQNTGDFRRILAAIDVGADYPETEELNKKIVELAHSLAQRERGESHYLHAWNLEYEAMLSSPRLKVSSHEIAGLKETLFNSRYSKLLRLLQVNNIDYLHEQIHMREGVGEKIIEQMISELKIDVVVMGSVGRSGIPGFLIGNKAEKLLNSIECTVITVKPDGFISPVTIG